ncbi:zinc-binding dehydrogenase [Pusillimonas sp. TS35]|uniref:NADP-dependent oxidoreductase n=1 Tax=Paracandidimonas lactea TaxID=2895524 RepID=UPI00136F6B39|nr:NADP-dependent oxidoreductase [Paracandidimonas lactea]MYN12132.1 zinc-binding dehydrogenase [Pusillimonas sp. TS35]
MPTSPAVNRQVFLKARPSAVPQAEHFGIRTVPVGALQAGQFLVRNHYLSVDPAMRGWVNAVANYSVPVGIGDVMRSYAAGRVVQSRHPDYPVGTAVMGSLGWQDYAISDGANIRRTIREQDLPLSLSLGVLGLNGLTAYFALTACGRPERGDTVVVSTAAGAVGSIACQLAAARGCNVVGITGGPEKVALCQNEFGVKHAIDYKAPGFEEALTQATDQGVDVYFDNTSGFISDAVIRRINRHARIVVVGTASISSWDPWPAGPRVDRHLLNKAASMQGFLAFDYEARYQEAIDVLAPMIREGRLRYREEILDGIEAAPGSIADLYQGKNFGKRLIRLVQD